MNQYLYKPFLLPLICLVLISCGTMKKRQSMIFADSTPRGLKVRNEKGEELGVTPFFFKMKADRKRIFTFYDEGKEKKTIYRCKMDWGLSLTPDLIVTALNPVVGGVFILTDFLSGGIYKCHEPLIGNFKKSELKSTERKKRILVLPIAVRDKGISDRIITLWKKNIYKKYSEDGSEVIWNDDVESAFFQRGMDHYADTHPEKIKRRFLNEVGEMFDGTHFLHFEVKQLENKLMITPTLYDAFTLKAVDEKYVKRFSMKDKVYDSMGIWKKIVRMIDILPNAIKGGYTDSPEETRKVNGSPEQSGAFSVNRHPDALPQVLTLIGLDSVHHPRFFDSWDYGGFLSPSLGASSWKSSYPVSGLDYDLFFESYYAAYDASVRIFTPFGQVGAGIGLGMMSLFFNDNQNFKTSRTSAYGHLLFDYTFFFNDRTFFKLAFDKYTPSEGRVHTEFYDLESWSEVSVRIGYYFPEIKALTRKFLPL